MTKQFFDAYGVEIKIDSVIAMAFRRGNSAEIRIGRVVEFRQTNPDYGNPQDLIKVQWRPKPNGCRYVEKSNISVWTNCVVLDNA